MTGGRPSGGNVAGFGYAALATVGFGFGGIFAVLAYEHGGDVSAAVAVRGAAFLRSRCSPPCCRASSSSSASGGSGRRRRRSSTASRS